jgi:hypothetical protein
VEAFKIDQLCDAVAVRHGIPHEWVRYHVDQKAGRPCIKCHGSGRWGMMGRCFRCGGTGGRGRQGHVEAAITWVEENIERVKALGSRRDANRVKRAAKKAADLAIKVQEWKNTNPRHWWALESMEESEFRTSLIKQLEDSGDLSSRQMAILWERAGVLEGLDSWKETYPRHWWALENMPNGEFKQSALSRLGRKGSLTENQMTVLWEKALTLEDECQGRVVNAPDKGTNGSWKVTITGGGWWTNRWDVKKFKVSFIAEEGWTGYFETQSTKILDLMEHRSTDEATVTAQVKWSKRGSAILGGRVKLELG